MIRSVLGSVLAAVVWLGAAAPAWSESDESETLAEQGDKAAATDDPHYRVSIYWENDGGLLRPWDESDQHYTNGAGVSLTWPSPTVADFLENGLHLPAADGVAAGLIFAQEIYTPANLALNPPDPNDRPYAGYLYGGMFVQREKNNHLDQAQLDLGVVGPSSLAQPTQTAVHDLFFGDDPMGWDYQLADEAAVQFTYRHKLRIDLPATEAMRQNEVAWQVIPYGQLQLGTVHRNVAGGATLRLGLNLPDDFGPGQLHDPGSLTSAFKPNPSDPNHPLGGLPDRGRNVYGFVRAEGRYVEWNTFLDGSNWSNPSPSVSKEPWVGELQLGISTAYRHGRHRFEFTYSNTWRTRSFETQSADDAFGAITFQWAILF